MTTTETTENVVTDPILFVFMTLLFGVVVSYVLGLLPKSIKLPYTVVMFLVGFLLERWGDENNPGSASTAIRIFEDLDPHLLLFTFIPPLLFVAGLEINPHVLKRQFWSSFWLAVPGVIISICLTALCVQGICGLQYGWGWTTSFMFSAIVSATDPVAVVALLHELGAPASLNVLIDGEAMLNDGSASVVFFVFRDFARGDHRNVGEVVEQISRLTFASIGIGLAFAVGLIAFIFLQQNAPTHEIMSTIGVAWITFWVAEGSGVQGSGILATVTLALVFALRGVHRVSPRVWPQMIATWESIAFAANTLLFAISGIIVLDKISKEFGNWSSWGMLVAIYAIAHVVRAITIAISYPILKRSVFGFTPQRAIILWWSGLRGAIGLALALIVLHDTGFDTDTRDEVAFLVGGLVLMTLLINGTTTEWLYVSLGLSDVPETRRVVVDQLVDELTADYATRQDALRTVPFFKDAEFDERFGFMDAIRDALHHRPSVVARFFYRLTPAELQCRRSQRTDSPDRELWATVLRSALNAYHKQFDEGHLLPHHFRLLEDIALCALEQHSDLEDCIWFEWQSLRKHVTAYPLERFAKYPVVERLHHLNISEKAYVVGQTFRLFLRSHHRALKIMNKHINVPEVAHVSSAAKAQLAVVEEEMYAVYQETFTRIPQLFPIMRDFYFMHMNFLLTTRRLEKLAEDGLLDHADLHTCTERINRKQALFNEWVSLCMLSRPKGDKWVEMPPGGYPFPPQFNEYIHLIADARKQMLQARHGPPLYITSGDLREPHSPTLFGHGNGNGNGHHTGPIFSTMSPTATQPIATPASMPTQMPAHMPGYTPVPAYMPGFAAMPTYMPDHAAASPYISSAHYSPLHTYMPQVPAMGGPIPPLFPLPQLHPTPVPTPFLAAI